MAVDATSFRVDLPEFGDAVAFPDSMINYWLNAAANLMDQSRWGAPAVAGSPNTLYDLGMEMFVAHNIVLERRAENAAANGAIPGSDSGPISSKSVGGVSVSFDTGAVSEEKGGHWNATTYGRRYYRLAKQVGMGPVQIGIGSQPPFSAGAWVGPYPGPGWFSS